MINEVLQEREEAVRIAQAYKSELERIVISDEDIEHLHNTVSNILEIFKNIQLAGVDPQDTLGVMRVQKQIETMEQVKNLISVDTLKTMQLLGFNYKAAIGEPLTQICSRAILSLTERKIHLCHLLGERGKVMEHFITNIHIKRSPASEKY